MIIDPCKGNRFLLTLCLGLMLPLLCLGISGCGTEEMTDDDLEYLMNEDIDATSKVDPSEAATADALNKDEKNFIGRWGSDSEETKNIYGSLEITINGDGTFDADVTGESFSGTWTKTDEGISYDSNLIKGSMYYESHGKLVIEDVDNGGTRLILNSLDQ